MSKIFVSHSHRDNAAAVAIGRWLVENGWDDLFLDISPSRGISPGERWQEALKRAADRCEAVVFLVSEDWVESKWCIAEFLLAKQLGKAVFGVLIRPTLLDRLPGEMRGEYQLCDLVSGVERQSYRVLLESTGDEVEVTFGAAGLQRLRRGIERAGLAPSTFPWPPPNDPDRPPYCGLRALDQRDAAIFFGREASITVALDAMRRLRETSIERLFVILGASGSGKSSFLRAGLLPRLARDDVRFFVMPVVRPERAAISGETGLLPALEKAFRSAKAPRTRSDLRTDIATPDRFAALVVDLASRVHARVGGAVPPTIVFSIDQGEELFDAEHGEEAGHLLRLLERVMAMPEHDAWSRAFSLVAIRSDSYERLQTDQRLASVTPYVLSLPPIPRDEFKTIIEGPAQRHEEAGTRLRVDPTLTAQLLQDTQGADALPLLAFTLERLFLEHGADGDLTLDDYAALGGVEGSIEAAVKAALADPRSEPAIPADDSGQQRVLRAAFIPWLAQIDPETEERKRRVADWEEIPGASRPVLERLIRQRLLVRDRRRIPGSPADMVIVEVAHEALLRRWPLLTLWLDQDADALKTIAVARRAAAEWVKNGRREDWLNHATERLAVVEALLTRPDMERVLGDDGRAYVRACRALEHAEHEKARLQEQERLENERRVQEAEQAAERQRLRAAETEVRSAKRISRLTRIAAAIALVLAGAAVWAAVSAINQQREAERALGTLNTTEAARKLASGSIAEAVAHLSEALRLVPDEPVWRASLISALLTNRWARITADIRTDEAVSATFSPDGGRLLVVAGDEAVIWNPANGARIGSALRHRNQVTDADFSPDGNLVATSSRDRTVRVWNGHTGAAVSMPLPFDSPVTAVAFESGGRRLLVTAGETRLVDWGQSNEPLGAGQWSRSGRYVLIRSGNELRFWDSGSRTPVGPTITPGYPYPVEFSDAESVAVVSSANGLVIVDLPSGSSTPVDMNVSGFSLSEDGRRVVVWTPGVETERTVVVIDTDSGQPVAPALRADGTLDAQLNADGSTLLTLSERVAGSRMELRQVADGRELASAPAQIARLCPAGAVAAASGNAVTLWNDTGARIGAPIMHAAPVQAIEFAAGCEVGVSVAGPEAQLWDTASGAVISQPLVHTANISKIVFSPQERYVATVAGDGVRVWNLAAGHAVSEPLRRPDPSTYTYVAFSANGERVATATDREVRTWDARSGDAVAKPIGVEGDIRFIWLDESGDRILVESWVSREEQFIEAPRAAIYRTDTGERIGRVITDYARGATFYTDEGFLRPIMSPDGRLLISVNGKTARIWNVTAGERQGALLTHRQPIRDVAFSRDGTLVATASDDASARVWSAATGEPLTPSLRHGTGVAQVLFSADGSRLVTIADRYIVVGDASQPFPRDVQVWDARTGESVGGVIGHDEDVTAVAVSPDGTRVLTASGQRAQLRDAASGAPVGNAAELGADITSARYSADGRRIATAAGSFIQLWDADRLTPIARHAHERATIVDATFVADDQRLLVVSVPQRDDDSPKVVPGSCPMCGESASLWDVPTAAAAEVPLLRRAAEILGGYRVTELGAIAGVPDRARQAAELLTLLDTLPPSTGERIVRWLLLDPSSRPAAPLAAPSSPAAGINAQR